MTSGSTTQCQLKNYKGRGFESQPSNMPVIFFHRTQESTEYTVLTDIGVWVITKSNILYPDANLTSIINVNSVAFMLLRSLANVSMKKNNNNKQLCNPYV